MASLLLLWANAAGCLPHRAPTLAWTGYDRGLPPSIFAPEGLDLSGWSVTWSAYDGVSTGCPVAAPSGTGWQALPACVPAVLPGSWGLAVPSDEQVQGADLVEESFVNLLGPPGTVDPYGVAPTRLWASQWALDLCGPAGAVVTRMVQESRPRRGRRGMQDPGAEVLSANLSCGDREWDLRRYGKILAVFSVGDRILLVTTAGSGDPRLVELRRRARLVRALPDPPSPPAAGER